MDSITSTYLKHKNKNKRKTGIVHGDEVLAGEQAGTPSDVVAGCPVTMTATHSRTHFIHVVDQIPHPKLSPSAALHASPGFTPGEFMSRGFKHGGGKDNNQNSAWITALQTISQCC